jgi:hypothetical protein
LEVHLQRVDRRVQRQYSLQSHLLAVEAAEEVRQAIRHLMVDLAEEGRDSLIPEKEREIPEDTLQ